MAVKPGDAVEPGSLLAVFYSPAIGLARAEVLQLKTNLDLASRRWDWEQKVVANTEDLIKVLSSEPDVMEVEKAFKSRTLGQSRETLMSAYSRYRLADQLLAGTQSIRSAGRDSHEDLAGADREPADDPGRVSGGDGAGPVRHPAKLHQDGSRNTKMPKGNWKSAAKNSTPCWATRTTTFRGIGHRTCPPWNCVRRSRARWRNCCSPPTSGSRRANPY